MDTSQAKETIRTSESDHHAFRKVSSTKALAYNNPIETMRSSFGSNLTSTKNQKILSSSPLFGPARISNDKEKKGDPDCEEEDVEEQQRRNNGKGVVNGNKDVTVDIKFSEGSGNGDETGNRGDEHCRKKQKRQIYGEERDDDKVEGLHPKFDSTICEGMHSIDSDPMLKDASLYHGTIYKVERWSKDLLVLKKQIDGARIRNAVVLNTLFQIGAMQEERSL